MKLVGIDVAAVSECVTTSFDKGDTRRDNWMLAYDQQLGKDLSITLNPTITINNRTYHGDLDGLDIFHALCTSFEFKSRPEQCDVLYDVEKYGGKDSDFVLPHHKLYWFRVAGVVLVINLILFWLCKRV